jgi:hypothetical protein
VTNDSPEVVAVIEKALVWLEKAEDQRLGAKCLFGLCFHKSGRKDHPKVNAAIEACRTNAGRADREDIYSLGLAVIFLCEIEQRDLRDLANTYLAALVKLQKPHGGWGYNHYQTGDTSQTQYAALALWTAHNHGYEVPQASVERLCGWLLRTQDPAGTWGYQGTDPGSMQRVPQGSTRLSLHVAGLGSLYICADMLAINGGPQEEPAEDKLPPALRRVGEEKEQKARRFVRSKAIDVQLVRRALAEGDAYFDKNYKIETAEWTHYYLYGLERYRAYKELVDAKPEPEPQWYTDGFHLLKRQQQPVGSWAGIGDTEGTSTSFATLFLLRSSRKAIGNTGRGLGDGVLLGGMGLPANTSDLREREGKVVETPLAGSIDELLTLIENPDNPELASLDASAISLDSDVTKRAGQVSRLRALVASGSYEARLLAVRTLGRARELDNVPVLIYALTDPDMRIVVEADKGLRFISRKFGGVGLAEEPQPNDAATAASAWKAWYRSVRPDAEFLD